MNTAAPNKSLVMIVGDHHLDRRVLDEARSLHHDGWDVTVITLHPPQDPRLLTEKAFPEIKVVRISEQSTLQLLERINKEAFLKAQAALPPLPWFDLYPHLIHLALEAVARPASIYMAHDLPQLPAAIMAAVVHGAKIIYDSHEIFPEQGFEEHLKQLHSRGEHQLIHFADRVITINQSCAEILSARYGINLPHVILNCTSTHGRPIPIPRQDLIRNFAPVRADQRVLLFQGNISERTRNLENVIRGLAQSKHKDVALVIVGPEASPNARRNLAALGEQCGILGTQLFFLEAIPQDQLLDITASADAGIIPYVAQDLNTSICTPNKLFEFLVAGIPILANSLVELTRFVSGEGVGQNHPLNTPEEVATALNVFFDQDLVVLRKHCAQVALKYSWDIQGRKVQQIVRDVASTDFKASVRSIDLQASLANALSLARTGRSEAAKNVLRNMLFWKPQESSLKNKRVRNGRMKVATIVGARPQFIKAAAVSKALYEHGKIDECIIHTGQHYDFNMSEVFFSQLGIPRPQLFLEVGSGKHGAQTGLMISRIEEALESLKPDVVLVYGDTNSTLAGCLAATKLQIPVAHVEAGLRAYTRFKPEEINRILTDHNSDILYLTHEGAQAQLIREGLDDRHCLVTGDVMLDVALGFAEHSEQFAPLLERLGVQSKSFALCSVHRAENTDEREPLALLAEVIKATARKLPVVLPLHPRTRARAQEFMISFSAPGVIEIEPVGFLEMTLLERHSRIIMTDSGGVQKEAYFHKIPCLTLRNETEWVETTRVGWNILAPLSTFADMMESVDKALSIDLESLPYPPLFGDGNAGGRIANHLYALFESDNLVSHPLPHA
jgi:UDP-GlcNAc3NAcA epimerase